MSVSFDIFSSLDEFVGVGQEIEAELIKYKDSLFFSPTWLIPFQKVLCKKNDVRHIIGRDESGEICGTIHFSLVKTPFLKVFHPRVLALLGTRSVVSPEHLEFHLRPEYREEWFQFLEKYIRNEMNTYAFAVFDSIADNAENATSCVDYLIHKGFRVIRDWQDVCPYLDLPGTYEELLNGYSANMRKIIRRTFRRNGEGARLVDYSEIGDIDNALEEARRLHNLARAEKGDLGSFDREGYMEFHREFANTITDEGKLYIKFLQMDGKTVAFRYGFIEDGVYYDYQTGYDPSYAERRPGFIIIALIMKDLIERKLKRFDFLRGDEPYKRHWARQDRKTYRYYVFPPGLQRWIYYALLKMYRGWR